MENYLDTIILQYASSPTILALLKTANDCIDPANDINSFYKMVWDVSTAQGVGLNIWGKIVGVPRSIKMDIGDDAYYPCFGFDDATGDYFLGFDQVPFYSEDDLSTGLVTLSNDAYRFLIMLKAMINISATNSPTINKILTHFFSSRGRAYVNDFNNMSMRYVFEFTLTAYERAIVKYANILPHPAGVGISYIEIGDYPLFGFDGDGYKFTNFDIGVFAPEN